MTHKFQELYYMYQGNELTQSASGEKTINNLGSIVTRFIHEFNFMQIQSVGNRRNSGLFQGFRNAEDV